MFDLFFAKRQKILFFPVTGISPALKPQRFFSALSCLAQTLYENWGLREKFFLGEWGAGGGRRKTCTILRMSVPSSQSLTFAGVSSSGALSPLAKKVAPGIDKQRHRLQERLIILWRTEKPPSLPTPLPSKLYQSSETNHYELELRESCLVL